MINILGMDKEQLLVLQPDEVDRLLSTGEVVYIAKTLDAYWGYNYEAAKQGRAGMHAVLKSGLHSDGFFVSRIFLQYPNIRMIMAKQLVVRLMEQPGYIKPKKVGGVPDGATELGKDMAGIMGVENLEMIKEKGRIKLVSGLEPGELVLLVEDFCTRGTGLKEAVRDIVAQQPRVNPLLIEPVILNRGGLEEVVVDGVGAFKIVAAATHRIADWTEEECKRDHLCKNGSVPIKPKVTDENWRLITTSQLA